MKQVVPFRAEHFLKVAGREYEQILDKSIPDFQRYAEHQAEQGIGISFVVGSDIIACVGLVMLWHGVAEGWARTSPAVEQHYFWFHREIKKRLIETAMFCRIWRIQAVVQRDHKVAHKWMYRLGFECEGPMRKYWPSGEDAIRYARIF